MENRAIMILQRLAQILVEDIDDSRSTCQTGDNLNLVSMILSNISSLLQIQSSAVVMNVRLLQCSLIPWPCNTESWEWARGQG